MSRWRVVIARERAAVLLMDIVDSTAHFYEPFYGPGQYQPLPNDVRALAKKIREGLYLVGFERFIPFGFVGVEGVEDTSRLVGPYLYRDYLGEGYGKFLLDRAMESIQLTAEKLVHTLVHNRAHWAIGFFKRWGFEPISDQPEFIKRWHDGVLAAEAVLPQHMLMARLTDGWESDPVA
jgi:GNAT superfamily N-acetyltransferase